MARGVGTRGGEGRRKRGGGGVDQTKVMEDQSVKGYIYIINRIESTTLSANVLETQGFCLFVLLWKPYRPRPHHRESK